MPMYAPVDELPPGMGTIFKQKLRGKGEKVKKIFLRREIPFSDGDPVFFA